MNQHICEPRHIEWLNTHRPLEYWNELSPALVETLPDGSRVYDKDSEAWKAAAKKYRPSPPKIIPKFIPEPWESKGPRLWEQLHKATLTVEPHQFPAWLKSFLGSLPCGSCKQHATALAQTLPPSCARGSDGLFAWGVAFHNAVSEHINSTLKPGETPKPIMSVEEARGKWAGSRVSGVMRQSNSPP